jgi:hypothetical protein
MAASVARSVAQRLAIVSGIAALMTTPLFVPVAAFSAPILLAYYCSVASGRLGYTQIE